MNRIHEIVLLVAFAAAGVGASWWYNQPPTPWMEIQHLRANYDAKEPSVHVSGSYKVNDECDQDILDDPVIWRIEAISTDGQVAQYGPRPPRPSLSAGWHQLNTAIPLEKEIYPDGWAVRILVTCPGEKPETIASQPALVDIGDSFGMP